MSPNEYVNGSGDPQYLNAEPSVYNPNYITVNPADIQSSDLTKNISSVNWQDAANWLNTGSATGIVQSIQNTTYEGQKAIEYSFNSSAAGTTNLLAGLGLTWNQLPSQNLAYDYATITGFSNGSATNQIGILLNNQTGGNQYTTWPKQISITNQSQITTTGIGSDIEARAVEP